MGLAWMERAKAHNRSDAESRCRYLFKSCRSRSATTGGEQIAIGVVNLDRGGIGEGVGARQLPCGGDYSVAGKLAVVIVAIAQIPEGEAVPRTGLLLPDAHFSRPVSVVRKGTVRLSDHGAVVPVFFNEGHERWKGRSHVLVILAVDALSGYCPDAFGGWRDWAV